MSLKRSKSSERQSNELAEEKAPNTLGDSPPVSPHRIVDELFWAAREPCYRLSGRHHNVVFNVFRAEAYVFANYHA